MLKNKRKSVFLIVFALFCVMLLGAVSAADTSSAANNVTNVTNTTGLANSAWPTYQSNNQHTGKSNYTGPQTNNTKWMYNLTVGGSSVVASDGTLYVGGYDGILYAFKSNGSLKWAYQTASHLFGSPTIGSDGTVYVSTWKNSTLYAFRPNGTVKWTYNLGDYNFGSSPVIDGDGTIYIPVSNGTFYVLNPNGTVKWTYNVGEIYSSSPAIGPDGTIYIANYNGVLHALNSDGTAKWAVDLAQFASTTYVKTVNVYYSSPSVGPDGTIYIAVQSGFIIAMNPDGTRKWIYIANKGTGGSLGEPLYGSPAISNDGVIYVVGSNNVYAVQHKFANQGSFLWNFDTGGVDPGTLSVVIGSDGTLYVGSKAGVYALNPDGIVKWSYKTGSVIGSPMIGADGTLYVGTDGIFYAFNDNAPVFMLEHVKSTSLTIQFTDKTQGNIKSWKWDFGDGSTSSKQNPTHTYSKAGKYVITLTITLQNGSTITGNKIVTVEEKDIIAPTVTISPNSEVFDTVQVVTFNAIDDRGNAIVYYTIDGSDPRTSGTRILYTNPFEIGDTITLKFAAVDNSDNWSPVYSKKYTILNVVYVQNASYYINLNAQIQSILDNAVPGSIITFLGQTYQNLHLTINKKLNIISNVGTKIYGSSTVFLINGSQASGTKISGFTIITDTNSAILVNNSSNVIIFDVTVSSTNGTAITVNGSSNTIIKYSNITGSSTGLKVNKSNNTQITGSTIKNNENGIDIEDSTTTTTINQAHILNNTKRGVRIYNSTNITIDNSTIKGNGQGATSDGGVYVQSSDRITITNSQIKENSRGIFTRDVSNVVINDNEVADNGEEGILLSGHVDNITIRNNELVRNSVGLVLNYSSGANVNVRGNLITGNSRTGLEFSFDYKLISEESIIHNAILDNSDGAKGDVSAQYTSATPFLGSNWYGGSPNLCTALNYASFIYVVLIKTGKSTYTVEFRDGVTNELVTDIPSRLVKFTAGSDSITVPTKEGKASAKFDLTSLVGVVEILVDDVRNSVSWSIEITGDTNDEDDGDYSNKVGLVYSEGLDGDDGNGNSGGDDGDGNSGGDDGNGNSGGDDGDGNSGGDDGDGNSGGDDGDGNSGGDDGDGNSGGDDGTSNGGDSNSSDGDGNTGDSSNPSTSDVPSTGIAAAAAAAAAASAGDSSSSSSDDQSGSNANGKTLQEVIVNEANQPEIWGIIVVILLVILVLGAYYRTDLMEMIRKSRK